MNWFKKKHYLSALFLFFVLGALAYGNAVHHPFVHDDIVFIKENSAVRTIDLSFFFSQEKYLSEISPLINPYYRPFLDVFYSLQYKLFALNPHMYHLTNIIIHIINAFLVYLLFFKLTERKKEFSFVIACLFLVHPVQSESVACIAGISNVLSAFFFLLSLCLYLVSIELDQKGKSLIYFLMAALAFIFALFTKEISVMLPILAIFLTALIMRAHGVSKQYSFMAIKKRFIYCSIFILLMLLYFLIRKNVLGSTLPALCFGDKELILRLQSIPRTLLTYGRIVLFPYDLHYYRSMDILQPMLIPLLSLGAIMVAGLLAIQHLPQKRKDMCVLGFIWFFVTLLPVLNVMPLVNEYSFILIAEHFLYLPVIGLLVIVSTLIAEGVERIFKARKDFINTIVVVLVLVVCIFVTIRQNTYFSGEISLFKRTLQYEPRFGRGRMLLAKAYYFDRQYEKAVKEHQKALMIMERYRNLTRNPQAKKLYEGFIKEILSDMGVFYEASKEFDLAIESYQKALVFDPADRALYSSIGVVEGKKNRANKKLLLDEGVE